LLGIEKNEALNGFHWRDLPLADQDSAARKFEVFAEEAERWRGPPRRRVAGPIRRLVAWPDIEIRQAGRAIRVRVRTTAFHVWWHEPTTWAEDPMGAICDWIDEEVVLTETVSR
jgi:hypothetical protein